MDDKVYGRPDGNARDMAPLRILSGLLVLLLAVPLASAAPAEGRLEVEGALRLQGPTAIHAPAADLLWNATAVPTLTLDAASVHVERRGSTHTVQKTPLGPGVQVSSSPVGETADHEDARVTLRLGEGAQVVALRAVGDAAVDAADLDVTPVQGAQLFRGSDVSRAGCAATDCLDAFGVYAALSERSAARLEGDVSLYLRGPTLVVASGGAETAYASGLATRQDGTLTVTENTWIVLTAKGATATLDAPAPAQWFAASPRYDAKGLTLDQGTGALEVGARTYRAQRESVDARGTLVVLPETLPAERAPLTDGSAFVPGERFAARVQGDVATINLRAAPVYADAAPEAVGLLALAGALVGGLAYYWPHVAWHATSAALPFYTRLKKPEILDNDVRNAIYDIIRGSPGISARAVQRESELSWGTVVYHLRQLERHHLVVSRTLGRTRNYYENHGKYKGMEVQLACLQSPRALTLARLVLREPGMTQEALAEASGYPQPTTSYYVRKLKQAGLVEEHREGRYARYLPNAELARFVNLAETSQAPGESHAAPA